MPAVASHSGNQTTHRTVYTPVKEKERTVNRDPVCNKPVEPETALYTSDFKGQTYYFCSAACKEQFDMNPSAYTVGRAA